MTSLKSILIFILLLAFWPFTYIVSSYLALGEVGHLTVHELYNFIPLGLISGLAVITPLCSKRYTRCLFWGLAGFMVAVPIAYFASLYGGLVLAPWLSATLLGSLPVLIFTFIGYKVGEKVQSYKNGYSFG